MSLPSTASLPMQYDWLEKGPSQQECPKEHCRRQELGGALELDKIVQPRQTFRLFSRAQVARGKFVEAYKIGLPKVVLSEVIDELLACLNGIHNHVVE